MKCKDILFLSSYYLKKHIMKVITNIIVVFLIALLVFVTVNFLTTLKFSTDVHILEFSKNSDNLTAELHGNSTNEVKKEEYEKVKESLAYVIINEQKFYSQSGNLIYVTFFLNKEEINSISKINAINKIVKQLNNELSRGYENAPERIQSELLTIYDGNRAKIDITASVISVLLVFICFLILGSLANNTLINLYDNLNQNAILRCFGLNAFYVSIISYIETFIIVTVGSLLGIGVSFAFKIPVLMLSKKYFESIGIEPIFHTEWWGFVIVILLLLVCSFFFNLFLVKKIYKTKSLLSVLKEER